MISLSDEQAAAAAALEGAVRVVAGAGTGKTAVITERYRHLLEAGVEPASILVMTFSERAAQEMRARIVTATGLDDPPQVGTFHSLAMRWLREAGERSAAPAGFSILAGPERWILMRELMWELADPALVGAERPDDLVAPLLKLQERLKQELIPLARLLAWCHSSADPEKRDYLAAAAGLFKEHGRRLRRLRLLDFDDLLLQAVRLLEDQPGIRAAYGWRHPWIMVDEYQDTNLAQERIVELLAGAGPGNVCVVGDDDQSIYRFRGASRASMERFLSCFPGAQTWTLGRNLRSRANIVAAAAALIDHNPGRLAKPLSALAAGGPAIRVLSCDDSRSEARAIAQEAARLGAEGVALASIAVLTRTHAIARPVGEALDEIGLPWQQRGGQGLYQRPEIRDLIATLRLLNDPNDLLALARLASRPPLSLDLGKVLARVSEAADAGRSPLVALSGWGPTRRWAGLMLDLVALKAGLGVDDLLFEMLDRSRYLDTVGAPGGPEPERAVANVSRFVELVAEYCERRVDHSLRLFVEHLELVVLSGVEEDVAVPDSQSNAVQVMSIHQAKGLEFEAVFIPSLVEGRLPQPRRGDRMELPPQLLEPAVRGREDHLAEERRLCYVAMTRARSQLWLSWAERYEGDRPWRPSRFLDEIRQPARGSPVQLEEVRVEAVGSGPRLTSPAAGGRRPARHRPAGAEDDALTLSYSAISTYRECPRQYRYRYLLTLPVRPAVEAQFGSLLHLVLMRAGRISREGREVTADELEALQREAWAETDLTDPRRRPALVSLGRRLLEAFRESGGLAEPPHLIEQSFTTTIDSWTLRGIIDRVDTPPTQEGRGVGSPGGPAAAAPAWRIVDYKTGAPVPASRLRRDLQLALYALGAREALGLDPVELEIVYLRDARRVKVPADSALLEEARRIGGEVAAAIREGDFEPRPERRRCQLCAYRLACDSAL
jgi:DNA helicase-2/ATP-dependent DNA helicase PcrA